MPLTELNAMTETLRKQQEEFFLSAFSSEKQKF